MMCNGRNGGRVSNLLVILAGLFVSSDLVWSMGASGIFKSILGPFYVLMQAQSLLLIGIFIIFLTLELRISKTFLFVCCAFVSIGYYEYIVSVFFDTGRWGLLQFIYGFLFPVMLIVTVLSTNNQKLFFRCYYIGYTVFLAVAIGILLFFDKKLYLVDAYGIGGALVVLRYHVEESWFFLILGNANKQSNYLAMSILLGPYLLELKRAYNKLYSIFVVFAVITLVLLCSRAALLLLPAILYLNRAYLIPELKTESKVKIFLLLGLGLIVFSNDLQILLKYIVFSDYINGTSNGFIGTFHSRVAQWSELAALFRDPMTLLHGIGVGNYGLMRGARVELGTHNLFLDHLVSSGLYGVLVLAFILGMGIIKSLRLADVRLLMVYFCFICFAMREYSFAYLYVTSMGGLIFVFILYLTFNRPHYEHLNHIEV